MCFHSVCRSVRLWFLENCILWIQTIDTKYFIASKDNELCSQLPTVSVTTSVGCCTSLWYGHEDCISKLIVQGVTFLAF